MERLNLRLERLVAGRGVGKRFFELAVLLNQNVLVCVHRAHHLRVLDSKLFHLRIEFDNQVLLLLHLELGHLLKLFLVVLKVDDFEFKPFAFLGLERQAVLQLLDFILRLCQLRAHLQHRCVDLIVFLKQNFLVLVKLVVFN